VHFQNGLEVVILKLHHIGLIPNGSNELSEEAINEVEKWVIGWIQRKMMYQKLVEEEKNQMMVVYDVLKQIQDYK
jgi:hypothetical protein